MRILYQFPLSHFCEKARWLLDHKELDYSAQNLTPGVHRVKIYYRTSQSHLPVLKDGAEWIADSTQIALYLDNQYPELTLIRKEADLRDKILEIDELSQKLGRHVRRWLFSYLLSDENNNVLDILIGEHGLLRDFEKYSVPALKFAIKKMHRIDENTVLQSKQKIEQIMLQMNQILIENGGRYLVGERLTLADIAVCSMAAPLLMVAGTPWEMNIAKMPIEVRTFHSYITQLPIGQYIQRIYETERNARIDWRGV